MASITVRNLHDDVKRRLRIQAAHHGRSMEEEARVILVSALKPEGEPAQPGLGTRIHGRFKALGGVDLELPDRGDAHRPAPDLE